MHFIQITHFRHIPATIRVLVDGGANRWFQYIDENDLIGVLNAPSFVCGDMDSITDESIKRLKEMKIEFKYTPDQENTDLTKAVMASKPLMEELGVSQWKNRHFVSYRSFGVIFIFFHNIFYR